MAITEHELEQAEKRMQAQRRAGYAVAARYDRHRSRIVVRLDTGVEVTFPTALAEGLAGAAPEALADIQISPAGLGLHWPQLDADLYIPALLQGVFGSRRWMAQQFGAAGGRARSPAKAAAARANGRKGGRPRKRAANG
ncbi:MAG: DUF2442 domain-containing protein [Gammaproteobacteria bacterium]